MNRNNSISNYRMNFFSTIQNAILITRKEKENSALNQTVTSLKAVDEDNKRLYSQIETLVDNGFDA